MVARTFWFRLLFFLLRLLPQLRWGVVHEVLDHVGSDQSESAECSMLHHKQCQWRVEVGLLWKLLMEPDRKRGGRTLDVSLFCVHAMDTPSVPQIK